MRYLFAIVFLCYSITAFSQDEKQFPAFTLRFSPTTFVETDGNVMLGLGTQFTPRIALNIDPGYVFYSLFDADDGVSQASGLKLRTELRYYLRDFIPYGKRTFAAFLSLEGHFKRVNYKLIDDFGMNFQNGSFDYYQRSTYTEKKKEIGALVKFGAVFPMSSSGKVFAEFFMGFGARNVTFSYDDIPAGGAFLVTPRSQDDFPYVYFSDQGTVALLFSTGIKLSVRLGKKK